MDGIVFLLRATPIPGYDGSSQDILDGVLVEVAQYPGIHAKPVQSAEEEQALSG